MREDLLASLMLSCSERLDFNETEYNNNCDNNFVPSIIIPTYNESQNILNLLNQIPDNLVVTTKVEKVVAKNCSRSGGKL